MCLILSPKRFFQCENRRRSWEVTGSSSQSTRLMLLLVQNKISDSVHACSDAML